MPDVPGDLAVWLRAQFDADEKRLRGGWYGDTHWTMLRTRLCLGSWTVSRENGVDATLNDRIADAGLSFMRELFDQWQADHAVAWLAEIDAKRRILELHQPDPGWRSPRCVACLSDRSGYAELWEPDEWPCLTVRALAAPYRDRPGWQDGWAVA